MISHLLTKDPAAVGEEDLESRFQKAGESTDLQWCLMVDSSFGMPLSILHRIRWLLGLNIVVDGPRALAVMETQN